MPANANTLRPTNCSRNCSTPATATMANQRLTSRQNRRSSTGSAKVTVAKLVTNRNWYSEIMLTSPMGPPGCSARHATPARARATNVT